MKKNIVSLLFILLSFSYVSAQEKWNEREVVEEREGLIFGIGLNIVGDSGVHSESIFHSKEAWNFSYPFVLNIEYNFKNNLSVATMFSTNKYKEGKDIDFGVIVEGSSAHYWASDIALKYSFRKLLDSKRFDPYLFLGFGYTSIGSYTVVSDDTGNLMDIPEINSITLNVGGGFNYWFSNEWAAYFTVAGKHGLASDATNQIQFSFGAIYKLKTKSGTGKRIGNLFKIF